MFEFVETVCLDCHSHRRITELFLFDDPPRFQLEHVTVSYGRNRTAIRQAQLFLIVHAIAGVLLIFVAWRSPDHSA